MRILFSLTYYRPHVSGLTIYVERLARELAQRGHTVTVLTSQYEKGLPRQETVDGVQIVRAPVLFRVSKGVIMPTFGFLATQLVRQHDVISLHLPNFDAAGVALRGRLMKKPTTLTYHSDLKLPPGLFNRGVNQVVHGMNHLAGRLANAIRSSALSPGWRRKKGSRFCFVPCRACSRSIPRRGCSLPDNTRTSWVRRLMPGGWSRCCANTPIAGTFWGF
jgi:glycosyltransferase involved in cell wall biosynthesis